jgi:hypothetical protein
LDNIVVVSPKYHRDGKILDNKVHYGEKYGAEADKAEQEKEKKKQANTASSTQKTKDSVWKTMFGRVEDVDW